MVVRRCGLAALLALLLAVPFPVNEDDSIAFSREFVAPVPGTLVICGGGDMPEPVLRRFVDAAGGTKARIVVVTTASETADSPSEVEDDLEFWRSLNPASLTVLHTRSSEEANDPDFARPLLTATGIWFLGGKQAWLTDTYLGTLTERLIHGVLKRGGAIGGESAGAAIMSAVMIRRGDPNPEVGRGFGFLPGTVIDQHFLTRHRQDRLMNVLSSHPGLVGLGIDEGTALIVQGRYLKVLGDSQVVACLSPSADRPASVKMLPSGSEADLVKLSRAANSRKPAVRQSVLR